MFFVGWLAEQRLNGHRSVSSRSLSQYLSAVRKIYGKLGLPLPPSPTEYPSLIEVVISYCNWESDSFSMNDIRIGMGAVLMRQIWAKGIHGNSYVLCLRHAVLLVFCFLFGLCESSVLVIARKDVLLLKNRRCDVVVRVLKGRTTHEAVLRVPQFYTDPMEVGSGDVTPLSFFSGLWMFWDLELR